MGYKHMPWVLELDGLNHNEKVVLLCLTSHANNQTRRTWVSLSTIARECGYSQNSRGTVRKALRSLREKGVISYKEQRAGTGEKQSSNTYTVHWSVTPGADNTRPPVSTAPGPGADNTTNEEPNEEVVNEESYSPPSSDGALHVAPAIPGNRSSMEKAANADPIGPAFYASEDRGVLINNVQSLAGRHEDSDRTERFANNLSIAFNDDDGLDFLIYDRGWAPPYKCSDRYEAAKWLNTFLHAWQLEAGPLTWRGQS